MICAIRRQNSGAVSYCWPVSCWPAATVPQAELRVQTAVAPAGHAAGDQGLRVDTFPARKLRRGVDIDDLFDEGRLIDRREQAAALQIIGDDLGDADGDLAIRRRPRHEIRDRDRKRRDVAFGHLQFRLRAGKRGQQQAPRPTRRRRSGRDGGRAAREEAKNDVTDIAGSFPKSSTVEHLLGIENRYPCISTGRRSRRATWCRAGPAGRRRTAASAAA